MHNILLILRKLYYLRSYLKFKKIGNNVIFSRGGKFINPEEIEIGNNVFINNNFQISARNLSIGNDIMIGPNLLLECDDHLYDIVGKTMFSTSFDRKGTYVTIENDVWIGANVTILKNVSIGEGVIVAAGSVVTRSLPPYTVCMGVPCKPKKTRFDMERLKLHLTLTGSKKNYDQIVETWRSYNLI